MKSRTAWIVEDSTSVSGPYRTMELEATEDGLIISFREVGVHVFEGKSFDGTALIPVSPQDRFERTVESYAVRTAALYDRDRDYDEDDETPLRRARRMSDARWRERWAPLHGLLELCAGQTSRAAGEALLAAVLKAEMGAHKAGDHCRLKEHMPETFQRQLDWEARREEHWKEEEARLAELRDERRVRKAREVIEA